MAILQVGNVEARMFDVIIHFLMTSPCLVRTSAQFCSLFAGRFGCASPKICFGPIVYSVPYFTGLKFALFPVGKTSDCWGL